MTALFQGFTHYLYEGVLNMCYKIDFSFVLSNK